MFTVDLIDQNPQFNDIYVPDILTNQSRWLAGEFDSAFAVEIAPISGKEYTRLIASSPIGRMKAKRGGATFSPVEYTDACNALVFKRRVRNVFNFRGRQPDGTIVTAKNGEELYEMLTLAGEEYLDVIADVAKAIKEGSHLEKAQGEVSRQPSGFWMVTRLLKTGAADTAEETTTTESQSKTSSD